MKEILYKKRQSIKNRRKAISVNEYSEDKECKTHVSKGFVYIANRIKKAESKPVTPELFIRKSFDTKEMQEKFSFKVKGAFFITRGRHLFRVNFCHMLRIDISWKNKNFSPKKSATLT
ncbi:MAG: hypothetical protein KAJ18_07495 [Candidatus Omnitrophica bacterium]|nr:hypothetical protein [Candidatus Omnitrophota bacterium]